MGQHHTTKKRNLNIVIVWGGGFSDEERHATKTSFDKVLNVSKSASRKLETPLFFKANSLFITMKTCYKLQTFVFPPPRHGTFYAYSFSMYTI